MSAADNYRVWVSCLGCYNSGILAGQWFEAEDLPEDMADWQAKVGSVPASHFAEAHEELWVMDHEGGLLEGEYGLTAAQEHAELLAQIDAEDMPMLRAYDYLCSPDWDEEAVAEAQDAYSGEHDSDAEFAEDMADQMGAIPSEYSWPASYIDWERAARDLMMDYSEHGGHYFRN